MLEGRFIKVHPERGWAEIFGHEVQRSDRVAGNEAVDWWTRVHYRLRRLTSDQWLCVQHMDVSTEVVTHLLKIGELLRLDALPRALETIPGGQQGGRDFVQIESDGFGGNALTIRVYAELPAGFALVARDQLDGVYSVDWTWFDLVGVLRLARTKWGSSDELQQPEQRLVAFMYGDSVPDGARVREELVRQHSWIARQSLPPDAPQSDAQGVWMDLYSYYGRQLQIHRHGFRRVDS